MNRFGINVHEQIVSILSSQLGVDESKIVNDAKLGIDLGADSLDLIEIEMSLEEKLDVPFLEDKDYAITVDSTVGDLEVLVEKVLR